MWQRLWLCGSKGEQPSVLRFSRACALHNFRLSPNKDRLATTDVAQGHTRRGQFLLTVPAEIPLNGSHRGLLLYTE